MIEDGIIQEKGFDEFPKKTEYSISSLEIQLTPVFNQLSKFGDKL